MKKKILLLLVGLILCGCVQTKQRHLKEHVSLSFFYVSTCPQCKEFKQTAIPYLEKTFGDDISIELYDLDEDGTQEIYDSFIDRLIDFDEEFYGNGPFTVVDGYFAVLGYTLGDEKYLADDIENALNHQPLSDELSARFYFKEIE